MSVQEGEEQAIGLIFITTRTLRPKFMFNKDSDLSLLSSLTSYFLPLVTALIDFNDISKLIKI